MPELELSIADAFDKGIDTPPAPADGSSDTGDGKPADAPKGDEGQEGEKPDEKPATPPEGEKPEDQKDKEVVDPENGTYQGEYTKERFNGLMSQWQKDRTERLRLERDLAEARRAPVQPANDQKPQAEPELPPELQDADDATKQGFNVLMKAVNANFEKQKQDILKTVLDKVTEPERRQTEETTKVLDEINVLSVEMGDDFAKNKKEILDYAAQNDYPLGTLKQAARAYLNEQALKGGRKTVEAVEEKHKKDGDLAGQGKSRTEVIPKFDPERDGNKSMEEIWDIARRAQ